LVTPGYRSSTCADTPPVASRCYYEADAEQHLFTGDSLFPGGPGTTNRDPQRFDSLLTDLEERVFAVLPDSTWVYPGHGNDTTVGTERPHVPEWRARGW
jgi:glyoxylase-like metal-dependent hydrolase (beta-lactamase superfamily II)